MESGQMKPSRLSTAHSQKRYDKKKSNGSVISYASMLAATIGAGVLIPVMWYIGVSSVAKYNLPTLVGGYTKKIRESITKRMSSSPKKSSPSPKKSVSPKG